MADIVILGAGPTGLSTAYHLEQNNFFDYKIFEKDGTTGGLCRSVFQDGFTFDYTGHLLHINDNYFKSFIESIIGFNNLNIVHRRSFIYSQQIYTLYPYQINLYGLPTETIVECIEGFLTRSKSKNKPKTFYSWVMQNFGAGFGKHFFFTYQEKIFSYNVKKLSASWTGRFVPATSLNEMIRGATQDRTQDLFGYNAQFFYPKSGGISFWVDALAKKLTNKIYTNFCVKSVDIANKIIYFSNGATQKYKKLVSTVPLDIFLECLIEPANSSLAQTAKKLICNSVINFNIGINRPDLSEKHWIYYPEKIYPFYRIGFPHNFSALTVPDGCSSLYGEFSYIKKSRKILENLTYQAIEATKKLLNIKDSDIVTQKIIDIKHAYVIFDAWRDKHINNILNKLKEYDIYCVGRYGEWKYSSMQEALLDGKKTAEFILTKYNGLSYLNIKEKNI